eukprot:4984609-Alexandrium_andersonii.AAC.1
MTGPPGFSWEPPSLASKAPVREGFEHRAWVSVRTPELGWRGLRGLSCGASESGVRSSRALRGAPDGVEPH